MPQLITNKHKNVEWVINLAFNWATIDVAEVSHMMVVLAIYLLFLTGLEQEWTL